MDRTVYIEIGHKKYPMRFSLGASIQIGSKYGAFNKMADAMQNEDFSKQITDIKWILELLIKQGCAYKNLFEKDLPVPEDAPVVDGKYIPPTEEEMDIGLDIFEAKDAILKCIQVGKKREVQTQDKGKNGEAM